MPPDAADGENPIGSDRVVASGPDDATAMGEAEPNDVDVAAAKDT